ncbi:MAG: PQQ-binding-like beta-propeller repeat protein [Bacteroidota bacterium]
MFLHDPQHTGRSPYRGPQEGKVEWLFDAGHNVYSSPAIAFDGTVYFGAENKKFFAVNPQGTQKWSSVGGGGDSSPLVANDGTVYCYATDGTGNTYLHSYQPDGTLNWRFQLVGWEPLSSPSISKDGEIIYIASKSLYAIRKNGTLYWEFRPDTTDACHYSLAMSPDGATLYVPGYCALYAVDSSGIVKWKYAIQGPSNPAVDNDGNVYLGGGPDQVLSLSSAGAVRWIRSGIYWGYEDPGPVIGRDGTIYIAGSRLYAFDHVGKLRWSYPIPARSQCVPAIDSSGVLYLGTLTNRGPADSVNFLIINPNGTLRWQMSLRSPDGSVPDIDSRPAISSDGKIYVGSDRARGFHLYKIR